MDRHGIAPLPAMLIFAGEPALAQALPPGAAGGNTVPPALAPAVTENIGQAISGMTGGVGESSILIFLGLTILSLAPAIAITVTCFPFIVTVLSILRQSLGLQQSPPNMLIVSLSLFLTWFVMDPVLSEAWQNAALPLRSGEIDIAEAASRAILPFERFMSARVDPAVLDHLRALVPPDADGDGLRLLIPSFMLTELQRAFEIGFLVALPFLVIDLVVSAVLMAMGMMMLPPAIVSLPFKLAFFVVVDGWTLISAALVRGYQ
ncbi:flagellar type III secretion system pore protein FliP [Paracoccus sediminicola]|uniref:flagellar type III secretion system pore protein FliP n=1 Tax=Paracoccus sediminicola TaxID=3017783 RepID=UPI0022F074F0|nr:flagellar type III secretion system pore protein FliP [Paracoccus sediminicola]WBU56722.1 flagellar type III secretion system pore protein FliP [Paracoccus sediminicola]